MSESPVCVYSAETIAARVVELGAEIRRLCPGPVTLLGILKGSVLFFADLARAVGEPAELSFVRAQSYEGTESSGDVDVGTIEEKALRNKTVVLVDGILDTGLTLSEVRKRVDALSPARVLVCVLLDKPERREIDVGADLVGFTVPDRFLVGYGLDRDERYRALSYVGAFEDV